MSYFRAIDPELRNKPTAVERQQGAACRLIPSSRSCATELEFAKKPVQADRALLALRHDLEMSVQQAAARRLTAAQDIAWALINSPAFLFNH